MPTVAGGAAKLFASAKSTTKAGLFQYPSDLFTPGAEPFMIFNIFDSVAKSGVRQGTIAMYMPPTLKVGYNAQYEDISLDWERFKAAIGSLANDPVRAAERLGANIITGVTGANISDQFELQNRITVNPHMAQLFRGVRFREFQFDFQMMARNAQESDAIQNIIYQFKYAMHPGLDATDPERWYSYPNNFTIEFFSPREEYLFKIGVCVLTGMEVDYAGSGVPSFFSETGAPVDVRMSLQFKELQIVTKESIQKSGF